MKNDDQLNKERRKLIYSDVAGSIGLVIFLLLLGFWIIGNGLNALAEIPGSTTEMSEEAEAAVQGVKGDFWVFIVMTLISVTMLGLSGMAKVTSVTEQYEDLQQLFRMKNMLQHKVNNFVLSQLDEGTIVDIYPRGKDPNYKPRKWKRRNKE